MTQEEFEILLKQLKDSHVIGDWSSAEDTIDVPYEIKQLGTPGPFLLHIKLYSREVIDVRLAISSS